jgi:hypothetical protein
LQQNAVMDGQMSMRLCDSTYTTPRSFAPARTPSMRNTTHGKQLQLKLNNLDLRVRKTEGKMGIPLEEEWITVPVILPQEHV